MNWKKRYENAEMSVTLNSAEIVREILKDSGLFDEFKEERGPYEYIIDKDHPAAKDIEVFYKGNKIPMVTAIKVLGGFE